MPLPPRLAHMVAAAADAGDAPRAARIAALLTERGLGGRDVDLRHRLEGFERDRSPRARDARTLADRWARAAGGGPGGEALADGLLLAVAFPERIAKARGKPGEFQLASRPRRLPRADRRPGARALAGGGRAGRRRRARPHPAGRAAGRRPSWSRLRD